MLRAQARVAVINKTSCKTSHKNCNTLFNKHLRPCQVTMINNTLPSATDASPSREQSPISNWLALVALIAGIGCGSPTMADEPGRLEADADFLLGRWSSDCANGNVAIFLRDGALRQQGLLRLAPKGGGEPITPVTLVAATRDGPGLVLKAESSEGGFRSSARYTARVVDNDSLSLKSMTLCRETQCHSVTLDVPWSRCG
jgi:hypothetical protein